MFVVGRLCSRNLQDACRLGFSFQSSVSFLTLVFLVAQLFVIVRLLWHCQLSLCARVHARARVCYGMLPVGSCSCIFVATSLCEIVSVSIVCVCGCVFALPGCFWV